MINNNEESCSFSENRGSSSSCIGGLTLLGALKMLEEYKNTEEYGTACINIHGKCPECGESIIKMSFE